MRWPDGKVRCPTCKSEKVTYLENEHLWKWYAKHPRAKFSLKVGTIIEDSPIGLDKWLPAMWLIANCKNGISITRFIARPWRHAENRMVHGSSHPARDAERPFEIAAELRQTSLLSAASPETCTKTKRPESRARAGPVKQSWRGRRRSAKVAGVKAKSKVEDLKFESGPAFERLRRLARGVLSGSKQAPHQKTTAPKPRAGNKQ